MLTDFLSRIPTRLYRWLLRHLGVDRGVHEWIEAMCPCGDHR